MDQAHDLIFSLSEIWRKICDFLRLDLYFFGERLKFCEKFAICLREDLFLGGGEHKRCVQGRQYGKPQFLLRSTVRRFCNGTGTLRWYGAFQKLN